MCISVESKILHNYTVSYSTISWFLTFKRDKKWNYVITSSHNMYVDKPIQVKADHFLSACQGGEKKDPFHLMMNSNFGDEKKKLQSSEVALCT